MAGLPGQGQTGGGNPWHPEDYNGIPHSTTKVPGYNTILDNLLDFIVKQTGASSDREVYRELAQKYVDNLLKDYSDVNTGPKEEKVETK